MSTRYQLAVEFEKKFIDEVVKDANPLAELFQKGVADKKLSKDNMYLYIWDSVKLHPDDPENLRSFFNKLRCEFEIRCIHEDEYGYCMDCSGTDCDVFCLSTKLIFDYDNLGVEDESD